MITSKRGIYQFLFVMSFVVISLIMAVVFNLVDYSSAVVVNNDVIVNFQDDSTHSFIVKNLLPIPDAVGKKLSRKMETDGVEDYIDFSVQANAPSNEIVRYEVYLIDQNLDYAINSSYIKVYLTNGSLDIPFSEYHSVVPVYRDLETSESNSSGKRIFEGELKGGETQYFRLRMWLADTYVVTPEVRNFVADIYVKVLT